LLSTFYIFDSKPMHPLLWKFSNMVDVVGHKLTASLRDLGLERAVLLLVVAPNLQPLLPRHLERLLPHQKICL
jgi:hypothetical protein